MADLLTLLRAGRWAPVGALLVPALALLPFSRHPEDTVGLFALLVPAAVGWLVDDSAAVLTASAPYGRRTQLAVRCGVAVAVAAVAWRVAVLVAGGAPDGALAVLAALLVVSLAAGITWGATYAGPAAGAAYGLVVFVQARVHVTDVRWWQVTIVAAAWLVVAARDPVTR